MKKTIRLLLNAALLTSLFSCATTELTSTWKSPRFQAGSIHKILVIGLAKGENYRHLYEDEFTRQLKSRGIDAVASYTILPTDRKLAREALASITREQGIDTVMVTRPLEKKKVQTSVTGSDAEFDAFYGYYGTTYDYIYNPGYMIQNEVVVIETKLYNATTEQLLWSGQSDTYIQGKDDNLIKSYIKVLVNRMQKEKLF